jgi:hypothetical protein
MAITLLNYVRPDPTRARDLVVARPADVAREARLWREFRELNLRPIRGASLQTWQEMVAVAQADGSALANSTTETSLLPAQAIFTVPANYLQVGKTLRWWAAGRVGTTGTPTLRLKICYSATANTNVLADTTALTTGSGMTNNTWWWRGHMTVRAGGSSGNVMAISELVGITGATAQVQVPASAPAVSSNADFTAAQPFQLTALWGTANASNTITLHEFYLEALN